MKNYDFDWQINEFMIYCRSTQLRERTMYSYEQTLRLFERWLCDELKIYSVDKVTENMIRKYMVHSSSIIRTALLISAMSL